MHGLLPLAYVPDTTVVDEPARIECVQPARFDIAPRPSPPINEARTVQVMLDDGHWHREMDTFTTACDLPIRDPIQRRPKKYEGRLSTKCQCWTPKELQRTQAANDVLDEDRRTGEFDRIDRDAPPQRATLSNAIDKAKRHTDRVRIREIEISADNDKENQKP